MNKMIITLTCLCLSFSISCTKKSSQRLLYLHYENSSDEKGVTTFEYNERGLPHIAVWELLDGSRFSLNVHAFDEKGNQIRKYREFSDGLTSEQTFAYDEKGSLINETFERSDGRKGFTSYIYNEKGNLVKAECQGFNGWFSGTIHYSTDSSGRKTAGTIVQKGDTTGTIIYTYGSNDDLIREHWDFSGQWSQTFTFEYDLFDSGDKPVFTSSNIFITNTDTYKIIKEQYDYNHETGGPSFFTYDKNGKLIYKTFERSDGLTTETTYLYDADGTLLKSYRQYSNGLHALFSYVYNNERKLTNRTFNRSDGISGYESYTYDDSGILKNAVYQNMDTWLTGTIEFSHDQDNLLDQAVFKGQDGFDAEIDFTYDLNNNPVKINWNFSFGKFQTYTFEYENMKK